MRPDAQDAIIFFPDGELSSDSDPDDETTVSEPEDIGTDSEGEDNGEEEEAIAEKYVVLRYPAQPDKGWKVAEKSLLGNLKTTAGKTKQSKYYYKEREKRKKKKWKDYNIPMQIFLAFLSTLLLPMPQISQPPTPLPLDCYHQSWILRICSSKQNHLRMRLKSWNYG